LSTFKQQLPLFGSGFGATTSDVGRVSFAPTPVALNFCADTLFDWLKALIESVIDTINRHKERIFFMLFLFIETNIDFSFSVNKNTTENTLKGVDRCYSTVTLFAKFLG
jgi:hypothetical protein